MTGLALLVAGVGGWTFVQQTRAARVAEQRVSFVNRVSHELRSPLTNILLNLDLAADALPPESEDAGRRLGLVQEEARRLTRLVDNVLSFSRSEQGKLTFSPQPCHTQALIAAVLEQFAAGFRRRGLEIRNECEAAEARLLDADAVAQVLSNLLSNVEKYVPGGLVTISSQVEADTLRIVVADQGPGIPAREAERIFRPFERLTDNVNEGSSGTGLGLAIARDLARGMGGHLRLLPTKTGATFELLVPAPAAPLPGFSPHPPAV
jgi:signal transduction histidine kinase